MKMKTHPLVVIVAVMLSACGEPPLFSAESIKVDVCFPEAGADACSPESSVTEATLPLRPESFSLIARVRATIPRLVGAPLAELAVDAPAEPDGQGRTASIRLAPTAENKDVFEGQVELRAPRAGPIRVRAAVAGKENFAEARIREPAVAMGAVAHDGWMSAVPRFKVCLETTATAGKLRVQAEGATLLDTLEDGLVGLRPEPCPGRLLAEGQSSAMIFGTTSAPQFVLRARLEGTSRDEVQSLVTNVAPLSLEFVTDPPELVTLPPAGSLIRLTAIATSGGAPAAGIPLRFQALPSISFLPEQALTDENGKASATFLVPEGITSLRIDAIAGELRKGISLRSQ